jgi:hypothetical protein
MDRTGEDWPGPAEPPVTPPPTPWTGYSAPPPTPPPPPAKSPKRLLAVIITVGLLGVACAGSTAYGVVKALHDTEPPAAERSVSGLTDPLTGASGGPSSGPASSAPGRPVGVTGKVPAGSKASSYKVRKDDDLERVCDRWYYPKSPKYTTAVAPHPILISVRDRKDLDIRTPHSIYESDGGAQDAWAPKKPEKVQLVACVDLVTIGPKVKSCRIDKPKPSSIPMKEGRYRLTLYEAATRRKLMETKLTGENESCPFFIVIGSDRSVYSGLEDRQLTEALRRYVEQ